MRTRVARATVSAIALVVLCAPVASHAETTSPFQMPDVRRGKRLTGELHLGSMGGGLADATVMGIELAAEFPFGDRSSFLVRMPLAHVQSDTDSTTTLGNVTLGMSHAMGVSRTRGRTTRWALSGSLSLPTASDSGDGASAAATLATYRIPYPGYYAPRATTLRVGVDSHMDFGNAFVQVAVGLRLIAIDSGNNQSPVHIGLAGGARLSDRFTLIGELSTMTYIISGRNGEEWFHTLDAGLEYRTGRALVNGRIYVPLDDSRRNGLSIIGIAVGVTTHY